MRNIENLKFNSLIAIKYIETRSSNAYWLFRCLCGKEKIICKNNVVRGLTKTCGCTRYTIVAEKSKTHGFISKFKNGNKNPRFYAIWSGMRNRCQNKNNSGYKIYGGVGITVDKKWDDFKIFYDDMYETYLTSIKKLGDKVSIDRIDNSKGYSKENCRWADSFMQARNRSSNTFVKFEGENLCISEFISKYGINKSKFYRRIKKGVSIENIHKELSTI